MKRTPITAPLPELPESVRPFAAGAVIFENGHVGGGDAHLIRQLGESDTAASHHRIQMDANTHCESPLDGHFVLFFKLDGLTEDLRQHQQQASAQHEHHE